MRFSSISCGLNRVLKESTSGLTHCFAEYSHSVGIMRHVVSLAANYVVLAGAQIEKGSFFQFYGRVWSAVDRRLRGEAGPKDHFDAEVDAFFHQHVVSHLPEFLVPVLCRQQECNALATAAVAHLHSFPERLQRYVSAKLVLIAQRHGSPNGEPQGVARELTAFIMRPSAAPYAKVASMLAAKKVPRELHAAMCALVAEERQSLASFQTSGVSLAKACRCAKNAHLLIPHLRRISVESEILLDVHQPTTAIPAAAQTQGADDDLEANDVFETVDDDEGHMPRVWSSRTAPRPFTILPIAKLKRAMVYYGLTELKAMFANLRQKYSKRKRDSDAKAPCAIPCTEELDAGCIGDALFTFKKLKGKKYVGTSKDTQHWRLSCFRTDGIRVVLTFCSGMETAKGAEHVSCLCEAGYQVPVPTRPVDLRTQSRGLYRVHATRNDLADVGQEDLGGVRLTVVDPGFHRPIQSATMDAGCLCSECDACCIAHGATFMHVSQSDWMQCSGRAERQQKEARRREVHTEYSDSIADLCSTRRRSCLRFVAYSRKCMEWLGVRIRELVCASRTMFRWKYERKLQAFLDRRADALLARSSLRFRRQPDPPAPTCPERREELARRLRELRRARRNDPQKHVVFFGDGTFSCTQRGHVSIPKKRLLKQLAVRGVAVLLGESYTSVRCPCGQDDLIDKTFTGGERVRVHKTDGGVCDVLKAVCDRDEIACVNMLLAAASALRHEKWPAHLRRR